MAACVHEDKQPIGQRRADAERTYKRDSRMWQGRPCYARLEIGRLLTSFHNINVMNKEPNAGAHLLPEAGATQERTLEAVRCSPVLGGRCVS